MFHYDEQITKIFLKNNNNALYGKLKFLYANYNPNAVLLVDPKISDNTKAKHINIVEIFQLCTPHVWAAVIPTW